MAVRTLETYDVGQDKVIGGFTHDGKRLKPLTPGDAELAAHVAGLAGLNVHDPKVFDELKGQGNGYYVVREPGDPILGHELPADHPYFKATDAARARRLANPD